MVVSIRAVGDTSGPGRGAWSGASALAAGAGGGIDRVEWAAGWRGSPGAAAESGAGCRRGGDTSAPRGAPAATDATRRPSPAPLARRPRRRAPRHPPPSLVHSRLRTRIDRCVSASVHLALPAHPAPRSHTHSLEEILTAAPHNYLGKIGSLTLINDTST